MSKWNGKFRCVCSLEDKIINFKMTAFPFQTGCCQYGTFLSLNYELNVYIFITTVYISYNFIKCTYLKKFIQRI